MKKTVMTLIVSLVLVATATMAQAAVLPLTSGFAPDLSGGIVAQTGLISYNLNGPLSLGTISQTVYRNSTGLVFAYDLNRNSDEGTSSGLITSMNASDYFGYIVQAGYSTSPASTGPDAASDNAGLVTFFWDPNTLSLGETSGTMYIQTDVQYVTAGTFSLQGRDSANAGRSQNFNGYAPTATPEPATVMLLGTGLLGLLGFRRKMGA